MSQQLTPASAKTEFEPLPWAAWGCALLWLLPFAWHSASYNDEWMALANARRVAMGAIPHLQYFQIHPGLSEWLLAPWLWLFPAHSLSLAHVLNAWVAGLIALLLRHLAQALGGDGHPLWDWLPAAFWLMAVLPHWPVWGHHSLALLGACLCVAYLLGPRKPGACFAAGFGLGFTALAIQLDGALVGLAVLAWLLWRGLGRLASWRQLGAELGWLGLGVLSTWLPYLGILWWAGGLGAFWAQVVLWPLFHYRQAGGFNEVSLLQDLAAFAQGWPSLGAAGRGLHALGLLLPFFGAGVVALVLPWWRPGGLKAQHHQALVLVAWVALFLAVGFAKGRTDLAHLALYAPFQALTVVGAAVLLLRGQARPWAALGWSILGALILVVLTGALWQLALMKAKPQLWCRLASPDARVQSHPAWAWAQAQVRPQDRILAAPYGGLVYASWGQPASAHTILMPPSEGYLSPEDWAAEWAKLARNRPEWLVLDPCGPWAEYAQVLPKGYREVAQMPSPLYGPSCPWRVFRRQDP